MDEELLAALDREAKPLQKKRSAVIREAVSDWLRRRAVERFEQGWIEALERSPDDAADAEAWGRAQAWENE